MTAETLQDRFNELCSEALPLPGAGDTAARHRRLMAVAREDVSLAKLAEAHWDAIAILAEAGRKPVPGARYAVWASEMPGQALSLKPSGATYVLSGTKQFCTGAGFVTHTLLTVEGSRLVEVDLQANVERLTLDASAWKTQAFAMTNTCAITFDQVDIGADSVIGEANWYVNRPGFWHGACGPAACWAGGAAGLLPFAMRSKRDDAHTLAHLGAMQAAVWEMEACLDAAGREIDEAARERVEDPRSAQVRALQVRHVVERAATEMLQRFARTYGPHPLAMDEAMSRRYQETELYLRQCHGERDLEALGRAMRACG